MESTKTHKEEMGAESHSNGIAASNKDFQASPRLSPVPDGGTEKQPGVTSKTCAASRPPSPPNETAAPFADDPPDGGYGWVCVACVLLINAHTWGLNNSYGVFLAYYLKSNHFPSATALDYALIGGLCESQVLLISPLANLMTRRTSTRTTLLAGTVLQTASLLGASWATRTWHLFLTQGVFFGWGMGLLYVASIGIPSQWFSRRRSLANGIASGGVGLGGVIYGLATNALIERFGLAWTFRVLAIISFVVNAAAALLTRDRNTQIGVSLRMFDHHLLKNCDFLLLLGWGVFNNMGYLVVIFSLPTYASAVGLTAEQGSLLSSLLNVGLALGRPVTGHYSDRFGRLNVAGLLTFLSAFLCFVVWILAKNLGSLIFFSLAGGVLCSIYWGTVGPVSVEVMGLKELPPALSMTWIFLAIPSVFAEAIALQLRSRTGDVFLRAQIFTGAMYVGAALCMWLLRARMLRRNRAPECTNEVSEGVTVGRRRRWGYFGDLMAWRKV